MCRPPRIPLNADERTARRSVPATFVGCVHMQWNCIIPLFAFLKTIDAFAANAVSQVVNFAILVFTKCEHWNPLF